MSFIVKELYVEYQKAPIGLDEKHPRFSWLFSSDEKNMRQSACRILVKKAEPAAQEKVVWDSGRLETGESRGVEYAGEELEACTVYSVSVQVWDTVENSASADTRFETGMLVFSAEEEERNRAWEGAQWIAAPRFPVCAQARGVFILETRLRLEPGSQRAGVVFGANDFRLLDKNLNEYGLAGENYIRYEINLQDLAGKQDRGKAERNTLPTLDIYRAGYAPGDRDDIPFASVPLVPFEKREVSAESGGFLITEENAYDFHCLRIEADGNNAFAYLDGVLVDAAAKQEFFGRTVAGRTLNPRGNNDVLTYPRLNEIGFFAGKGDSAYFTCLSVRNMRKPSAEFIRETPEGGLYGREGIFREKEGLRKVRTQDGESCFMVSATQVTADPSHSAIPMFRTLIRGREYNGYHASQSTLTLRKRPVQARLYITSRGIYECRVNGQEITDRLLAPGNTQYDKRLNYQTYDISDKIGEGDNCVGITLASGWWSDAQTFTVKNYNFWGDKEAFVAKIVITYDDGSRQVRVSNTQDWSYYGEGPYRYSGFFLGEQTDGRKLELYETYSRADFAEEGWERPVIYEPVPIEEYRAMPPGFGRAWPGVNATKPLLLGGYDAPVYVVDSRKACRRTFVEGNTAIYDLGQEMAGVPRIRFQEKEGTRLIIRYGEMLYPDLPEYTAGEGGVNLVGRLMVENYRDATSTDVYICSGKISGEIWQPRFTFHGYRYIEISGACNPPLPEDVESLQYSSVDVFEGSFHSSNALLDRFAENVKWSQRCNFINIPTDCPQRNERMGWAGDTHVFCHTALHNGFLKLFYERNLQAMADLQEEDGQFPEIAPVGGGFGGITYECASIYMVTELYRQYGDKRTITAFYPGLKKYMGYMKDKGLPGRGDMAVVGPLGDWLAPQETDLQLMWNAFYYREAALMAELASVIGEAEDAAGFRKLAEEIKDYWNRTFIDPADQRTITTDGELCDTQCSYVLALEYGVVRDREKAAAHLLRKTRELGHTVGTGFFGTGLLNQALSKAGYTQDAYKLMLQTAFPSWLYPVTQGATSIWEHWDSYTVDRGFGGYNAMNSFNHYSLGSVLSWMYEWILGIRREEEHPGYSHFHLEPCIGELEMARGSVSSPYGTIRSGWEKKDGRLKYFCEIPPNTGATLVLPDGQMHELGSGSYCFVTDKKAML